MDPDSLRLEQLTKEMVAAELRRLGDPCEAAVAVLTKTLSAALTPQNADLVIDDAVKGAMTALLLADLSVARGAGMSLDAVIAMAAERGVEPDAAARAALHALASLRRFIEPSRIAEIEHAVETRRPGAGALFAAFLSEPLAGDVPSREPA